MSAVVFVTQRFRLYWLERGQLWKWSRISFKWWLVRADNATHEDIELHAGHFTGGRVLTRDEVLEIIAEAGSPSRPRVEAGGPCLVCGMESEHRVYLGNRGPFCTDAHRQSWVNSQPVIDRRSTRN